MQRAGIYSEQISLSGGVGQEEFWMEIRRVGEVDAEEAKRKLRDLKEVAMSIKPMIELAKKKVFGRRVSYQGFFFNFARNRDLKRPKVSSK